MCSKCGNVSFSARRPFPLPMGVIQAEQGLAMTIASNARDEHNDRQREMYRRTLQAMDHVIVPGAVNRDDRLEMPND